MQLNTNTNVFDPKSLPYHPQVYNQDELIYITYYMILQFRQMAWMTTLLRQLLM